MNNNLDFNMDNALLFHQCFTDFDQFCENVRDWNLEFNQLDSGHFSSELFMFGNSSTMLTHAKLGRKLSQKGLTPQGMITFGVMSNPDISMNWRNININGDMLFIFPDSGELSAVSNSDFNFYLVSLNEEKLNRVCDELQLPDIRTLINGNEAFYCYSQTMAELRHWFLLIKQDLASTSITAEYNNILQCIEQILTDRLISILTEHYKPVEKKSLRKRDVALLNAANHIAVSNLGYLTVPELCTVSNVSERTLEYAFRDHYDLTPNRYILISRLNGVRKLLRKSNTKNHKITDIARQYGFWHMGKFSADYKKLFGELPSETLKSSCFNKI